jgi:hypothetical protein
MNKDTSVTVLFTNPKVTRDKTINIISSTNKMSIDFKKVKGISSAVDFGNKELNWEINLDNGDVLYLDSLV